MTEEKFDLMSTIKRGELIRGKEREKKILITTIGLSISKVLSLIVSFALVPVMLKYLGQERFGLWMTISSSIAMFSFADMGVGSGVQNSVSIAHGRNDINVIREKVSNSVIVLFVISIVIICVYFLVFPMLHWQEFFGVDVSNENEVFHTISVAVVIFAISMPCSVGIKVLAGLQRGFEVAIWQSLAVIGMLIFVIFSIYKDLNLTYIAISTYLPSLLFPFIASFILFKNEIKLDFKLIKLASIKKIGNISILFFVLQVSGLIALYSDTLIIAGYLGVSEVAVYSVSFKLFTIPSVVMSFYLSPLWPAYAEANSRGDICWIHETFLKSLKYSSAIVIPASLLMLFFGNLVIEKWVGQTIQVPFNLMLSLFFWTILTIIGGNFSSLLNGLNIIKFQVLTSVAMAIANVVLSVILVQRIGVSGVVWGSVISLFLFVYVPTSVFIWKYFK